MTTKGSIKNNDFSRGASKKGQVTQTEKQQARQALLASAKAKQSKK
ncbi:hypothetical protein G7084_04900 [Weissella coleopterorum]|uniref:Uncharacterized protein n=1 Tax=Weissella coleopterorum TaxID=2714949 RepID=A0A6G8B039_9LACO|nr:hypothetical protein [Weissella coleopterorum]QIL50711.1 hypothetical protein G7084_04900 [Weissella coleopterorum]